GLFFIRELTTFTAPRPDCRNNPADHLANALLALGRGHAAAEVLLRDDVRRGLRPELGELDGLLLEDGAFLAGDQGVARLPLDLLERVAAGDREEAAHADFRALFDDRV